MWLEQQADAVAAIFAKYPPVRLVVGVVVVLLVVKLVRWVLK